MTRPPRSPRVPEATPQPIDPPIFEAGPADQDRRQSGHALVDQHVPAAEGVDPQLVHRAGSLGGAVAPAESRTVLPYNSSWAGDELVLGVPRGPPGTRWEGCELETSFT